MDIDRFIETEGLSHIALNIITNLDAVSLARFRLVCKSWCIYVTRRSRFWWVTLFSQFELKAKTIERIEGENGYYRLMKRNHKRWKYWKKVVKHFVEQENLEYNEALRKLLMEEAPFVKDKDEGNVEPLPSLENQCRLHSPYFKVNCYIDFNPHEIEFLWTLDKLYEDRSALLAERILSCSYEEAGLPTTFILAVTQGMLNLTGVLGHRLIKHGIDLNKPLPHLGNLHECFHEPIIHVLVLCSMQREHIKATLKIFLNDLGIDINVRDCDGAHILHGFLRMKQNICPGFEWEIDFIGDEAKRLEKEILDFILAQETLDINAKCIGDNTLGISPLFFAIKFSVEEWVQAFLQRNDIDINLVDVDGWNPMIYACRKGRVSIVKALLSMDGSMINFRDRDGRTLLHHFIQSHVSLSRYPESEELLKYLLRKIDINVTDNDGATPLHYFCRDTIDDLAMLQLLLEQPNIDVNATATLRRITGVVIGELMTPLHVCCSEMFQNGYATLKLLLERSEINPEALNTNGETPMDIARQRLCLKEEEIAALDEYILSKKESLQAM